jgi:hypothetical protein
MPKEQETPAPEGAAKVAESKTPDIETLARRRVAESFGALDIETARQVVKDQIAADASADAEAKAAKKAAK